MEKLDTLVAGPIERRLLKPERLEGILSSVLRRGEERAERRAEHVAELRKRAAEADAKLMRLYETIENRVADLSDPRLKDRVAEPVTIRDQSRIDAECAAAEIEKAGPIFTPDALTTFARQARRRMRDAKGGCRRDHLRALAQGVEVDERKVRIMSRRRALLRAPVSASGGKTAGIGVPNFVPKWRAGQDKTANTYSIEIVL
jgi:hypothetical protein